MKLMRHVLVILALVTTAVTGCAPQRPDAEPDTGPVTQFAATIPAPPAAVRTTTGAQDWLDYYYALANYGHHTQDWKPLLSLHGPGCGPCDAITAERRLAGPGDIKRSPIIGEVPAMPRGGSVVELVTAVERVPPGSLGGQHAYERYIDRVTLAWNPNPREGSGAGWTVAQLTFDEIE